MTFYHKVTDPKHVRRALLEAAREPLILLSIEKNIEEIRKEKKQITKELQESLKDLSDTIKTLDKLLPEKQILDELKPAAEKKEVKKTKKKKSATKVKEEPMTEEDRLAYTLKKIEEKLASLN